MAETRAVKTLTPKQWDDKFFVEHIQGNRFSSSMGKSENSIIQVKEDLTKAPGDTVHFSLVNRLTAEAKFNGATLEGNEEELDTRGYPQTIRERAHGVRVTTWEEQLSAIGLRDAAKMALKTWALEDTRDRIIRALGSIDGVAYASATATQRNDWHTRNKDRILYGSKLANHKSGNHANSLVALTAADDKFTSGAASLMKRLARTSAPKIHPVSAGPENRYYYTFYVPSLVMRDLKKDPVIMQAQREVSIKQENMRLFKGGDIVWDGLIFKEIEDILPIGTVGANNAQVFPVYMCGAQALAYAVGQRWKTAEETFDYGRKKGCAIMEMGDFGKMRFGTADIGDDRNDQLEVKDHGMITSFFVAEGDA